MSVTLPLRCSVGVLALLAAAACSGPEVYHQPAAASHRPAVTASPTPRHPPTPKPKPTRRARPKPKPKPVKLTSNPLTGLGPVPRGRVIAVKIDDTAAGRPQTNINAADVVYVEQVEAGLTRLVAVYASRKPDAVGPVRSVRLGDPLLLAPYGGVAMAFSGGARGVVTAIRRTKVVDNSAPVASGAYFRSAAKPMPYNLYVNLHALAPARGARVRDVGFRWARQARGLASARVVHQLQARVGGTPVGFRWDPGTRKWNRQIDGQTVRESSGAAVSTPNVIVQFSKVVTDPRDVDVDGSPSANTATVGSGRALIFRDGRVLHARWIRRSPHALTRYVTAGGTDIPLHPGGAWVLLSPRGSLVKTS
jgi:hypothetical protein